MSGQRIAQVYFYIISIISIVLLVIGIYSIVTFILNSTQYEKYPPRYMAEDCESLANPYGKGPYPASVSVLPDVGSIATISAEEKDMLKKQCETRVDFERKQHKLDDLRNSIVFSLVGLILFAIHFPQAKKYSDK